VDNWLRPIQDTMHKYEAELASIKNDDERLDKLCELNIIEQIISVGETTIVQDAWDRGQTLYLHGWIYRIAEGIYRDMKITVASLAELDKMRQETYQQKAGSVPA
jgi:carbonic anhydrase